MLSRISNAPLERAEPMTAKASGSMGCFLSSACSRMAENSGELLGLPVLSLTPRCSAMRFAKLHVVLPTYVAEQRHV